MTSLNRTMIGTTVALAGLLAAPHVRGDVITLSRSNGNTVDDARLELRNDSNPNGFGAESLSAVGSKYFTRGNGEVGHLYDRLAIHFDLSDVPANATVTSATLGLTQGGGSEPLSLYRLTNSFTESGVT